jgi:hypothetical protein
MNLVSPADVVGDVASTLRSEILPALAGADLRRQCRSAAYLLELVAHALRELGVEVEAGSGPSRTELDRLISLCPPGDLGAFVSLEGHPLS